MCVGDGGPEPKLLFSRRAWPRSPLPGTLLVWLRNECEGPECQFHANCHTALSTVHSSARMHFTLFSFCNCSGDAVN